MTMIPCPVCGSEYKNARTLRWHSRKKHAAPKKERRGRKDPTKPDKCPKCSKMFSTATTLRKHKQAIHEAPRYGQPGRPHNGNFDCKVIDNLKKKHQSYIVIRSPRAMLKVHGISPIVHLWYLISKNSYS